MAWRAAGWWQMLGPVARAACITAHSFIFAAACADPPAYAPNALETQVLAAFNAARTEPGRYAAALKTYRGYFHQKIVVVPGAEANFQTEEGVAPVDEAIGVLNGQAPLAPLEFSSMLARSAAGHVADQGATGKVGHYGSDGSTPGQRVARLGGGKGVAEIIAYGAADAADVIRQLFIDDGVADRGHRVMMLADHLRFAGVACGPHPEFRTMCVIDMADTPDGHAGGGGTMRVAAREGAAQRK